jgi:hypothetical protein
LAISLSWQTRRLMCGPGAEGRLRRPYVIATAIPAE